MFGGERCSFLASFSDPGFQYAESYVGFRMILKFFNISQRAKFVFTL
jgi:hypothetical protein